MGCASSNPLVEGGKNLMENAKDTTDNLVTMGETAIHNAGDAVSTGVEHVKNAVESGITSAQNTVGSFVHSIEDTIGTTKATAVESAETAESTIEDLTAKASDTTEEAISDAKTVLAFEDATTELENSAEEFGESIKEIEKTMEETLHLEDMEMDNVEASEHKSPTPVPTVEEPENPEEAKPEEEPPLTPWEAAADEMREQGRLKSVNNSHTNSGDESDLETDPTVSTLSKSDNFEKDVSGNTSDILLSDTISIKSYKSEI